jgi:ABC-type Fe3+-hydroxamate transport system substrate-binding protein
MKIISLVPSQSELLWHLGLREELAGITKFCIHPDEMFRTIPRVGGTKTVNIEKVRAIGPHLIIANKEENERSDIEALQKEFKVHITDIYNLDDALEMIETVGQLVNKPGEGKKLSAAIRKRFDVLPVLSSRKKAVYLIWKDPFMAAGKNTFIDDMLLRAGFENIVTTSRYPELTMEKIIALQPEVVLLSSEPYPFKEKHIGEFAAAGLKAQVVDGEMFSWYGSRLLEAPEYFKDLRT